MPFSKRRAHAKTNTKRISTSKAICQIRKVVWQLFICMKLLYPLLYRYLSLLRSLLCISVCIASWHRHFTIGQRWRKKKEQEKQRIGDLLMLLFASMSTEYVRACVCMRESVRDIAFNEITWEAIKSYYISIRIDAFHFSINSILNFLKCSSVYLISVASALHSIGRWKIVKEKH